MQSGLTQPDVEFLELLTVGEPVEILNHQDDVHCRGTVEEVAPELGVAWIRTDMGERKLLDIRAHSGWRFSRPDLYTASLPGSSSPSEVLDEKSLDAPWHGVSGT